VRARLNEVIRALGYEIGDIEKESVSEETRRDILGQVSTGKLTPEEAVQLLRG
jgi:hypothetical protein